MIIKELDSNFQWNSLF